MPEIVSTDSPSTSYPLVVHVTPELNEQLETAIDYLQGRVLGRVPAVFIKFANDVSDALWEGWARDDVAVQLVSDSGEPLSVDGDEPPAPEQLTPEDEAAWIAEMSSPEFDIEQRRAEYLFSKKDETTQLYLAWLEDQAADHRRRVAEWNEERRAALRAQFDAAEHEAQDA